MDGISEREILTEIERLAENYLRKVRETEGLIEHHKKLNSDISMLNKLNSQLHQEIKGKCVF